jgi:hypothetical protein
MFGIEFDLIKKIEVGFCAAVLLLAGFFIWSGTRKPNDDSVSAWTHTYAIGMNDQIKISDANPEDPKRSYTITVFSVSNGDGELEFKEYPKRNDGMRAEITFNHRAKDEKDDYQVFPPMMRIIIGYKDPTHRAIAMATVCYLYHSQNTQLFNRLMLSTTDRNTASNRYKELLNGLALLDSDVASGIVEPNQYAKVMAALDAFRALGTFDFKTNLKLSVQAKKVTDLAIPYAKIVQDRRLALIDTYVDDMIKLLTPTQKETAVKIGEEVLTSYRNLQKTNAARRVIAK